VEIDWDKVIEYKSYPRGLAFYSEKHNKIYVNPILLKYPLAHEFHLEHEKKHYIISNKHKKNFFKRFVLNLKHEWCSFFAQYTDSKCKKELNKCYNEFRKIRFSEKEIEEFNSKFLFKFPSRKWLEYTLYEYLRPETFVILLIAIGLAIFFYLCSNFNTSVFWFVLFLGIFSMFCFKKFVRRT